MDDTNVVNLHESQHEWAVRLVRLIHSPIYDGIMTMFKEADSLCIQSEEPDKYLMTFQNFLSRVPKWNDEIISKEVARIIEKSKCTYLEDLLTCVHITHLKILSTVRTSKTQKKVEIDIPKLNTFIHTVYIHIARELYSNVYLFNKDVQPLVFQQNRNEITKCIKEAVLNAVRDSIPVDKLLRAYLDETTDLLKEEKIKEKVETKEDTPIEKKNLSFSDNDMAITVDNQHETIHAPKDEKTLEQIADIRNKERKAMEAEEEEEDKIKFVDDATPFAIDIPIEVVEPPIHLDFEELK
uniref:Uncharacterized protein n=1 Tax=viral metagenome TaxID=1070528 RepID=A0A6C0B8E8_9ZZZZ